MSGVAVLHSPLPSWSSAQMGTPTAVLAGEGNLAVGSRSSMVEQEEAGGDGAMKPPRSRRRLLRDCGTRSPVWLRRPAISSKQMNMVMAYRMKLKFQKYWDICFLQICVPVVLDPRFKLGFISFRLSAGFGDKGPTYTKMVKATVQNLFSAYSSMAPELNYSQAESNDVSVDEDDSWAEFEQHLAAQKRKRVKSELDTYLQDDLFPRQKQFDILQWWMIHSTKYPVLSRMVRDVFAAPASSVAFESAFSTTGRIVSDYRSRLTSNKIQALVCLQDWLKAEGLSDVKLSDDDIGFFLAPLASCSGADGESVEVVLPLWSPCTGA